MLEAQLLQESKVDSTNTGGPAFPTTVYSNESFQGMTLRDYFAAKAMDVALNQTKDYYGLQMDDMAKWCFQMADAMLKERAK